MRQRVLDEVVELLQRLGAVERPAELGRLRLAHGDDAGGLDLARAPNGRGAAGGRPARAGCRARACGSRIEVPPPDRVAVGVEQHAVAPAQLAVEMLEQPLCAAGEDLGLPPPRVV